MTAQKFDQNKPRMDLLDPQWLEGVARILTFGAEKYAAHNWRQGIEYSRLLAATQRHLNEFAQGFVKDPESGESHLLHAACNLMMLYNMVVTRPELNDLYWADTQGDTHPFGSRESLLQAIERYQQAGGNKP